MRSLLRVASSFMVLVVHLVAFAQTGTILRDSDISESALIEALIPARALSGIPETAAPRPDEADDSATHGMRRTRSIRVTQDAPPQKSQSTHAAPAKTAAASLLITFETNSATLTPRASQSLDVVASALKSERLAPFRFSIEGHADPRGNEDDNLELSRLRAESVAMYLSGQHQIDRTRLTAIGKGQTQVINLSQIDAPENRRVTIKTLAQ